MSIFSTFVLERPPLTVGDVIGDGFLTWLRVAGGFAAFCILVWALVRTISKSRRQQEAPTWGWKGFVYASMIAFGVYLLIGLFWISELFEILQQWSSGQQIELSAPPDEVASKVETTLLVLSSVARLSSTESVRRKISYFFLALMLVILFANWFVPHKPEDQVRNYVGIVDKVMTPLLILPAALLAAFAIPTDIKKQTIHTIVTKPVERFEIISGRIIGYSMLMTLMLFIMSTFSLFFVLRGINPEARAESLKARVPIYGELSFIDQRGRGKDKQYAPGKSTNVGREWGYRGYIEGADPNKAGTLHYAVWDMRELPSDLDDRQSVRCEVTFDIYRTTKGREKKGVSASFFFETWQFTEENREAYRNELREGKVSEGELAKKYGYFEAREVVIADFHTIGVDVPVELFHNAQETGRPPDQAPLRVWVRCDSTSQFIGMARYDLFLREDDPSEGSSLFAFIWNFYKYTFGIWFRLVLFVSLCVAFSARLGGVLAFMSTALIYVLGGLREFLQEVASGKNIGGGPLESAHRLVTRQKVTVELKDTTVVSVIRAVDSFSRAIFQPIIHMLPDVSRYNYVDHVANGFNIGLVQQDLLPSFLMLVTYLLPWLLLGFYMLKTREIAGAH